MLNLLRQYWYLAAILLLAISVRLAVPSHAPDGLLADEVTMAQDALRLSQTSAAAWPETGTPLAPLIAYPTWLSLTVFGNTSIGVRFPVALAGLLTVVFVYLWGSQSINKRLGLIAAAFTAVSFWPLYFSRVALAVSLVPMMVALTGWLYSRAVAQLKVNHLMFTFAGVSLGLTLHTSAPGIGLLAAFLALYVMNLLADRTRMFQQWQGHLAFWGSALLIAAPVFYGYGVTGWAGFTGWIGSSIVDSITNIALMWTHTGDSLFHYNLSRFPVFNVGLAGVFVVGLLSKSLYSARLDRDGEKIGILIPLTVFGGMLSAFIIDPEHAFRSASVALPATYLILASGFDLLFRLTDENNVTSSLHKYGSVIISIVVVLTLAETVWTYFLTAPANPQARQDYHLDLARIGEDIQQSGNSATAIAMADPSTPQIFSFTLGEDRPVRWFDPQSSLVIPASEKGAKIYFPSNALPGDRLAKRYFDLFPKPVQVTYSDGEPTYLKFDLPSSDDFLAEYPAPQKQGTWVASVVAFPPADPDGLRTRVDLPVRFGDNIELLGYQVRTTSQPGQELPLLLVFRVLKDSIGQETWSLFSHLLTPEGQIAAQHDGLAAPAPYWRKGDIVILAQDIPLESTIAGGIYHLQIGLYDYTTNQRFLVVVNNQPAGDRLLLEPVTITAP